MSVSSLQPMHSVGYVLTNLLHHKSAAPGQRCALDTDTQPPPLYRKVFACMASPESCPGMAAGCAGGRQDQKRLKRSEEGCRKDAGSEDP